MIRFNSDMNLADEFVNHWNQKVKSVRTASFVISILMILLGILCFIFPMETMTVIEVLACIILIVLGVYQIIDYARSPLWFRSAGNLVSGILNIILGIMLLFSPRGVTTSTFAFLFGWILLLMGIEKISFGNKLNFFAVTGYGWLTESGIFNIIAALLFIFLPLASMLAMNFILAAYLLVGGITLLVEAFSIKTLNVKKDDHIIDM